MKRLLIFIFIGISFHAVGKDLPKNVIKINLAPVFLKTISLQYERTFLRNFSLCLQFGQSGDMSMGVFMNRYLDSRQNETLEKIRSTITMKKLYTSGSTYITPELRLYLSLRGAPKGVYIAPYYRIATTKLHAEFMYQDSNSVSQPVNFEGRLNGFYPGVMLGYQKTLLRFITMDVWLGGVQWGSSKATLEATGDFHTINKQGVRDFLQDNVKDGSADVTIEDNKITANYNGKTIGFRFGFCIGIAF